MLRSFSRRKQSEQPATSRTVPARPVDVVVVDRQVRVVDGGCGSDMDDELSVERYLTKAVGDFTAGLAGDRSVEQHHVPARLRDGYALLAGVSQDGR